MQEVWTVLKVLHWSTDFLKAKGIDSARLDAEILLAHVLRFTRIQLYINFEQPLSPEERASFRALLSRRAQHEPIAQIIQEKEFYGRSFKITGDVLIPRPDTELIIEETLRILEQEAFRQLDSVHILDIGTGSGCLAITLDKELQRDCRVVGMDISKPALVIAQQNQQQLEAMRTHFVEADIITMLASPTAFASRDRYHLIVSNPPYIPSIDHAKLMPSVKNFEPASALVGGEDGLLYYHAFASGLQSLLYEGGKVVIELGVDQAQTVYELFASSGWSNITIHSDLAGIPRVLCAERS